MTSTAGATPIKCANARYLFLCTGEGAHAPHTDVDSLKLSPSWAAVDAACHGQCRDADSQFNLCLRVGDHAAPYSPVVTTVINLLNANRWRAHGLPPCLVLGHSVGEVAAASVAGLLSIDEALHTALFLGRVAVAYDGAMVGTHLSIVQKQMWPEADGIQVTAINSVATGAAPLSVNLCGSSPDVRSWVLKDPDAIRLRPPHPWHHPVYACAPGVHDGSVFRSLPMISRPASCLFVTATFAREFAPGDQLDETHWRAWLTSPVNFKGALERSAALVGSECCLIELGAHPVLTPMASERLSSSGVSVLACAASMRRGQPQVTCAHSPVFPSVLHSA